MTGVLLEQDIQNTMRRGGEEIKGKKTEGKKKEKTASPANSI